MTRLDKIRERYKAIIKIAVQYGWCAALSDESRKSYFEDANYLLGLLALHPANKPPDDDGLVIVRWQDKVSLGRYFAPDWWVRGWVVIDDYRCPVENWQELPPAINTIDEFNEPDKEQTQ